MSKIINCLSVLDNNKKKFIFPSGFRWIPIIILNVFFTLLVLQSTTWAGLSNLSVDANGDSVFDGENEKLTITFTTSDYGDEDLNYTYEVFVVNHVEPIFMGTKLSKNQTVSLQWDGKIEKGGVQQQLPDGDYTILVKLDSDDLPVEEDNQGIEGDGPAVEGDDPAVEEDDQVVEVVAQPIELVLELTADVTIDTKAPEITIDIGFNFNEFSPDLYSLPVYYSIDEDVSISSLLFQRSPGDASTGRPIPLNSSSGSHTYYWKGDDYAGRTFDDGKYTLRLRVIDKGGNEVISSKTEEITIDTEKPRITGITLNDSISLVNGMLTNVPIQRISFSADAGEGTPLNPSGADTDISIRPVGGNKIKGALTYGDQPTFALENPLDDLHENGEYEVTVIVADRVGNLSSDSVKFTFDNVPPIIKTVATNRGELSPGTGVNGRTNYVEAVLEDNIQLNLASSSIRLIGPDGSHIVGQQSQHADGKIRWNLLSPLLANNGLQDGQYTIEIIGKDKAENDTSTIQISFLFDNLAPKLVSLKPSRDGEPFNFLGDTVYYNSPINQFIATFSDGEFGTGVVYSGTQENSQIVFGTENEDGEINRRLGRTFTDDTNDVLTFILNTPLIKTDGSQDGEYVLNVTATDKLGNTETYPHRFVFDTQLPTLSSTVPAANQTVSNLSEVVIKLNEVTSGIDFVQSNFQLKRSDGENQVEVPVNIQTNGTDTATLTPLQPIALDGSDDGTYTIEITPTDLAGNSGAIVRRQFYLVSQTQPKIRLTTPETGTISSLGDITIEIENYIGSGINFDDSTITVSDAHGIVVPQDKVEADEANNQLTWSTEAAIPRNGTADGEYTVSVVFVDFSGQSYTQQFSLVLDTQFPGIDTVSVGTDPPLSLSISTTTDMSEAFSQIIVGFDSQDIDFENTVVTLTGPDGIEIVSHRSDDGNTHLTLDFQNLAQLGAYTLSVIPIDRIGNVSVTPFVYRFHLNIDVPVVTAVLIGGQSGAVVYVNGSADEIIATLTDSTGTGLALGEGESRIVVSAESGLPVPGITTSKGVNQLIWRPIALPTDGSADGRYIVAITPVDKAGRTGDVVYRSFIFDTQAPRISASSPVTLHQPISYIDGSLAQFQFTVEDIGPALLDLDAQTIGLQKKDGEAVSGQITHDGINQIFYTLSAPLPTNGSADGEYTLTVNLVDQAGNTYKVEHNIFYDSQAPSLSSVSLDTDTPLDLTPYQVTNLSESISKLTLNFVEMTRVDFANTGTTLIGPDGSIPLSLENNGVDQLTVSFVSLTQGGLYTLSVTPQDIAGNVAQGAVPYPFSLEFEVPGLSSVIANTADTSIELIQHEIIQISESINSLVLSFTDASRIDFENTQVILTDINGQEIPITKEKNADTELVVRFVSLTQSGLYMLTVTPQDRSGNTAQAAIPYQFRLDIDLPTVNSVLIDGKSSSTIYVNDTDFSIIATFIESTGVGLAFGDEGSNIVVTNANGLIIQGVIESNGSDQLNWSTTTLPSDGSADGRYTVSITPIDNAGRTGKVVNQEFIYDTQAPRITSSSPATLHQPTSYIGGSLTQLQFAIEDIGPASFDIDSQIISLNQMDGEPVQGEITHDGTNRLFFTLSNPLPTDGSADGKYTLNVTLVDKAGNVYQTEHDIFYDSQEPQISSVSLNTGIPLKLVPYEVTNLSETINEISFKFDESTGVDFSNTIITLMGPEPSDIPLTLRNNGVDQITASFVSLTQNGLYTLSVTPQDITGNASQGATQYPFRLEFQVPGLSSVVANTTEGSLALIPYEIVDISESVNSFTLVFTDSDRIDFENTSVSLTGDNGQEIPVSLEVDATHLNVRFVALTQGGMYTLSITPQDISGNAAQGSVIYPFQLKFEVSAIASVKATTEKTSVELIQHEVTEFSESVNGLTLEFIDASQIDFENTNILLTGPTGEGIAVTTEEDEASQLVVRFVPLIQSGEYTLSVTPQDITGNTVKNATQYQFRLVFPLPGLSSVVANTTAGSVVLTPYETVDISESVNSFTLVFTDSNRIDFENTSVSLTGGNGQEIPVSLEVDATHLNVRFVALTQGGMYTLSITPQDISGNAAQGSVIYPFQLKFQVSAIASVKATTEKTSVELIQHDVTEFSDSVNGLTLEFIDASQIDFENTSVLLTGPTGEGIAVTTEEDEASQLVVRFVPLIQSGEYTLSVTPQDITGNTAKNATQYQFRLVFPLPLVSSVLIDGKPGSTVYVSKSIPIIIATFSDNNGIALSLEEDGSTIVVTNPEGMLVSGVTTSNGSDQLTWRPTPLPTDGSSDGKYAVTITPVDKSGRTGTVVNQQFIYDSQAPRITSATPLTIHAPVSYIGGGLSQFVINIEDVGPAGIVLASQVAALQDSTGNSISANLTYDEIAGQLYLTLTQPFANDGSMDGTYTLNVLLIDKAGNRLNSRFKIIYDSKMPQVSSVTANTVGNPTELVQNQVTDISESISTIIVKFAEATLVDFANTTVSLLDPDNITVPITVEDDGVSQLTLNFVGLTQIGQYTLTLIPQDVSGNTAQNPIQYSFLLRFILPDIESIVIGDTITLGSGDTAYVNADNLRIIANFLDPAETGLSFDVITGSEILVATLDNTIVPGSTATNGTDLLVWEPLTLSTDGSSDGRYAVYVTPIDKKGRSGNTEYREFIYDTQEPEITSADPINLSQPVSYISDSLTQLSFTLQDVGPADIILDDQNVSLRNQSGALIPTQLTHDSNNQFYLTLDEPLPLDGSRDGEYTVVTAFSDKAGNVLAIEHPIVYDTQAPTLVSTVPANGAQLTEDVTQIQVNLNDEGGSGIDWTLTTVTLVDPNRETISGELTSNGRTQLTLRTNQLVADGRYVIQVQAIDRAGNGSNSVFENSFLLSRRLPAVLSTLPITAPAEEAYTNEEVDQIEVRLETADENHLSTLRLLNADGQVVAGQQQRSSGRLVYTLIRPLATDGSEDGIYTIEFTPISASGRSGEVQQLTFTYDTQVPEIESEAIILVVSEPEVNNSLIEIQVAITDNQSGIDWENLDEDWINFERVSPNATEIEGRVSFDEQDNLIFRLTVPLADNGSADGKYRIEVTPIDQAGNGDETYEKVFTYDTSPPVIDPNSLLLNDLPLLTDITAEDYPSAISTTGGVVVQASVTDTGLGVNLSQSRIIIINPNGQEVSGTTHQNGVDTIIFKSDGLPVEGIYQVNVTGIGNDSELLGFAPKGSITTEFLYETTEPTGVVTDDGGKTELTDEPIPFQGTATDPQGVRRVPPQQGDGEIPIPASGVWLVEIVGTGPDGQPIEPVPAEDESDAQQQPWSSWTADFLPTRSGEYDLDLRVTDKAGNFAVYDIGEYTMSVSFSFSGNTFGWPNPLRHSKSDVAFFSFNLNAAAEENVEMILYIYDWGGDLVYSKTYTDIISGERSDTHIKWNLENQSGTPVARGLYVFRLEAVNGAGNRANAVGKMLVVD